MSSVYIDNEGLAMTAAATPFVPVDDSTGVRLDLRHEGCFSRPSKSLRCGTEEIWDRSCFPIKTKPSKTGANEVLKQSSERVAYNGGLA